MKKRLLSAALALAMVLTMLPLSVMPAFADAPPTESGKTTVTYYSTALAATTNNSGHGVGWYWYATAPGTSYTQYYSVTSGVIAGTNSGLWYQSLGAAYNANQSTFTLLGPQTLSQWDLTRSVTVYLNGQTLTSNINIPNRIGANATSNPCSQLTITDTVKAGSLGNGTLQGSITVGSAADPKAGSPTINLTNVNVNNNITVDYTTACTVNVMGSTTKDITLKGTSGGAVKVGDDRTKGETGAVSITTTGTTNTTGGTVTAYNAKMSSVSLSGVGASMTGTNVNVTSAVTLFGLTAGTLTDSQKSTLNTPSVTLNGGTVASIGQGSGEALTKAYTVTLNGNANVTDGITLDNANVTVNNSAAGPITVKNGDVKLNGSSTGPASAGLIKLGADKKAASLTVTGTNVTTGNITKVDGTVNVTVPESDTNSFGELTTKVDNRGISGGVWDEAVPADNLNLNLRYQASNNSKFRYYSDSQFQNVLDAYQVGVDTVLSSSKTTLTLVKDDESSKSQTITFKNGDHVLAVVYYGKANLPLVLPSSVNGHTVLKWSEYDAENNLISEPTPGTTYSTPSTPVNRVLNAQALDNTITKLVNVHSTVNGITARLNGNVITLSGAVPASNTTIQIQVTTDGKTTGGKPPVENQNIFILYDNGKVTFANQNGVLPKGMSISNDYSTLTIGNGTASYTLNGSGLRVQADGLTGKIHGYEETVLPVIVTVNCSGTGWTTVRKAELAAAMSNDYDTAIGSSSLKNSSGSKVSFADSPAVMEALNAAVAGITQSQIDSWILNAQNAACRKAGITNPTPFQRQETGYKEVHLVAYMAVNVTNYNTANTPGALTMTLTPSYYVEVTGANGNREVATKLDPNNSSELSALRPVNNRSLGSLTGAVTLEGADGPMNTKGIDFTLDTDSTKFTYTYAHQGNTYGYRIADSGKTIQFRILHAVNGSLGQFIVDGQEPMVSRYKSADDAKTPSNVLTRYETLQAAVDDAKDDQYIDVNANYKGSCNITVTGTARKFTINTHGANKVTSNVSGVVAELAGGNEYQVQLVKDTLTPSGNVAISVASVANGYARVSASSVKPGTVVTITATPNAGYVAGTPSVRYTTKTSTNNVLNVSAAGSNTWTFTVPTDATGVTVTPSFVRTVTSTLPFNDVATNAWYYSGVEYCWNTTRNGYHLMEGVTSNNFSPNNIFTRAQMVQVLWNIKGRPTPGAARKTYTDVSPNQWYYNAIVWATNNGYADGFGDGRFGPDRPVKRDELVEFLWKFAGRPSGTGNLNVYADRASVPLWAQNSMRWATGYNILSGQNSVSLGSLLSAESYAMRSEVAVTVTQYHGRYGG